MTLRMMISPSDNTAMSMSGQRNASSGKMVTCGPPTTTVTAGSTRLAMVATEAHRRMLVM